MKTILLLISFLLVFNFAEAKIVAIDIGHFNIQGKQGATGASGTPEVVYNKIVGEAVKTNLEEKNVSCFLIENMDLRDRVKVANLWADIFVSIHHDSVSENLVPFAYKFSGFSIFVSSNNTAYKDSLRLGKLVGSNLIKNGFYVALHHQGNKKRKYVLLDKNNGVYSGSVLTVLKETNIPAILVECGVIKNMREEAWLELPEIRKKLVLSISTGIEEFFERWYMKPEPQKLVPDQPKKRQPIKKVKPKQSWVSA